jgi:hypothetical protein
VQICRIPRAHNDAAVIGVGLDGVNHLRQLIHSLTSIARVRVFVLRTEEAPLVPVAARTRNPPPPLCDEPVMRV